MGSKILYVIGLMSGTSLDGLDLAYCRFKEENNNWNVKIIHAQTIEYERSMRLSLKNAHLLNSIELRKLDVELGHFFGEACSNFILSNNLKPDFVASHGHTIFHDPNAGYTLQIGDGATLHAHLTCPLIFDFRSADVALGGQGAPLVPIGDKLLFANYDACVNLGGFANISFDNENSRIAFDICPVNIVLNEFARLLGKEFDSEGAIAKRGNPIPFLIEELNKLDFYSLNPPKSLGREWVADNILPLLEGFDAVDVLTSFTEHSVQQIANVLNQNQLKDVLFTGGGVKNTYLMSKIREKTNSAIHIPSKDLIDFKEAMIFAFLGVLRMENKNNVLASVTGASRDHCAGSVVV